MGFNRRDSSLSGVNQVSLSSSQAQKKRKDISDQREDQPCRLRSGGTQNESRSSPFNGFMVDPMEDIKEEQKEEVVDLLMSSLESDDINSPSFSDDSATLSSNLDSPHTLHIDRLNSWVSLIDLDHEGEDCNWVSASDSDLEFKCFQDIPSPSCRSSVKSSLSEAENENSHYDMSMSEGGEQCDGSAYTNEPLFWPFERKCDWSSWDGFCMSPRKNMNDLREGCGGSCRRRLVFTSKSTKTKILDWKERSNKKGLGRSNGKLSRLSKSAKASMKVVPLDTTEFDDIRKPGDEKLWPEGFLNEDFHIESIVGLGEFDGHEGVDPEFNQSDFIFL